YNTICTPNPIHGRCRSIFQDGEALHVGGVNGIQVPFKSIDQNKRTAIGTKCSDTSHPEFGNILAWLTTGLHRNYTSCSSTQQVCNRRCGCLQALHINCSNRTYRAYLSLNVSQSDNNNFIYVRALFGKF